MSRRTRCIGRSAFSLPLFLLAGCASNIVSTPNVPQPLLPPTDAAAYLEAFAKGVQIYDCARKDSSFEWKFKAPEATLADRSGKTLGKHYAGPTWESTDGSSVVGEVKAKDPGPQSSAIPWLLLAAKSHAGKGVFADARYIQRVATTGGIAPPDGCSEKSLGQQARVTYTATYVFYK